MQSKATLCSVFRFSCFSYKAIGICIYKATGYLGKRPHNIISI